MTATKCPFCGASYEGLGALSRADNKTAICPRCGEWEAFGANALIIGMVRAGVPPSERARLVGQLRHEVSP